MKKLLIFLTVMLMAAGVYAGIIYDNTTNNISASSGTMTIDGSAVKSHIDASAQVHGLASSINVLGNADLSGEYVRRVSDKSFDSGADGVSAWGAAAVVTYGSAFSATPRCAPAGTTTNVEAVTGVYNVGTSTATVQLISSNASTTFAGLGLICVGK